MGAPVQIYEAYTHICAIWYVRFVHGWIMDLCRSTFEGMHGDMQSSAECIDGGEGSRGLSQDTQSHTLTETISQDRCQAFHLFQY